MTKENYLKVLICGLIGFLISAQTSSAHVSEQGIVLLLPTDIYITSGILAVIFSMAIVTLLPHDYVFKFFKPIRITKSNPFRLPQHELIKDVVSILSFVFVIGLIVTGAIGSRDPLVNLLPLTIWTLWWIAIFVLHAIFGNFWAWINPWTGLYNQIFKEQKTWLTLPQSLGVWPATILFVLFYMFIIADIAPDDPSRLSNVVLGYLVFTFFGMIIFGKNAWLTQVECFTILFRLVAQLSPIGKSPHTGTWQIGLPGWKAMNSEKLTISQSFFLLSMLASGSFDGVNETFWWLVQIDVNPLAFPGRSAVIWESTLGMLSANLLLYSIFAICIWIGTFLISFSQTNLSSEQTPKFIFASLMPLLAISVLPITAVYHASHYLTSFMVNGQYFIAALSDPLANGSNYLGLENYQVTTGYLNDMTSVEKIWLTQAGIVVVGHIIAVLMAHYAIAKHFENRLDVIIFHIPISIFMATYTWFGLWLLAAPKGA